MKYSRLALILSITMLAVMLFGCKKDDNSSNNPAFTNGTWIVHLFMDSGSDETSDFAGYDFVFATDGKVTATKSGVSASGTWAIRMDDGKQKFDLNMASTDPALQHLNNDWIIYNSTSTMLELGDDRGASGEVLHFMKK